MPTGSSTARRLLRWLVRRSPSLEDLAKTLLLFTRYRTERALIRGNHITHNEHPSIIHFSFNRAATQYTKSILARCAAHNDLVCVSINDYAFHSSFPFLDHLSPREMEQYQHIFKPTGYLYSVFGGMVENIPSLERYRIVLITRDPRDILVSAYFSLAYSHTPPSRYGTKYESFSRRRQRALESSIDEFVLKESNRLLINFQRYDAKLLEVVPDAYVTRYEDMVEHFDVWLARLLEYCDLPIGENLRADLITEHYQKMPRDEDIHRHVRKGRPGDFQQKLAPTTIQILTERFAPFLDAFGYEQSIV